MFLDNPFILSLPSFYSVSTHDHDDMKPYIATTKFTLPTIPVLSLPIQISAELPAYGVMLTPFPITFILSNKTIYPQVF